MLATVLEWAWRRVFAALAGVGTATLALDAKRRRRG